MTIYRRPDPIPRRAALHEAPSTRLRPVRAEQEDLHLLVARQIFGAIDSGVFAEGSILPTEDTLSHDLGVSRTALREAIKGLVSKGLLETRRRRGTMVLERGHWNMLDADLMSWSRLSGDSRAISNDLWQAMISNQVFLVGIAAETRHAEGLRGPVSILQNSESLPSDKAEALVRFHLEIALPSVNPFLISMTRACLQNLLNDDPEFLAEILSKSNPEHYGAVAEMIGTGNVLGAQSAIRELFVPQAQSQPA